MPAESAPPAIASRPEAAIGRAVRSALEEVREFIVTQPFHSMLDELWSLPPSERPAFVDRVILNRRERERRGVHVPADLVIQRSTFGDARPTLFCVTKKLPREALWHKVTFTFDNPLALAPRAQG